MSDCEELVGVLTGDDGVGFRVLVFYQLEVDASLVHPPLFTLHVNPPHSFDQD